MAAFQTHEPFPLKFLQNAMYVRESSICEHTLLILCLLVSFLRKLLNGADLFRPKYRDHWCHRFIVFTSLVLSIYNLVLLLCCFKYLRIATIIDLALRALAWLLVYVHLKCRVNPYDTNRFPLLMKIWWGLYIVVTGYCLASQVLQCWNRQYMSFLLVGSDIVCIILGILLCFVGNSMIIYDEDDLRESLLTVHSISPTVSPYSNVGFFSSVTFSWVGSLISKGYNKRLDLGDLPPLSGKDNVTESYLIFGKHLESSKGSASVTVSISQLAKSLIYAAWSDIVCMAILSLLQTIAAYVGPYLIGSLVRYLSGTRSKYEGFLLVFTFLVAKLVECVCEMHYNFRVGVVDLRTKAVLEHGIYKKTLKLSSLTKEGCTSGEVINLMSVDADRVGSFSAFFHDPWIIALKVVLAMFLLYKNLKLASVAALIATVLVMLTNYPLSNLSHKYYDNIMKSKDKRMKATTEILKNMRILKLQAWEMKFFSKIVELRDEETKWLRKSLHVTATTTCIFWVAPIFVSVVTFSTCIIIGVPLDTGKILSAIATFGILQDAIHFLPIMITTLTQTRVSLSRIALFLSFDELDPDYVEKLPRSVVNDEVAVEISGGNFSWDPSTPNPTLKDIEMRANCGTNIAVCGTVGSGKSTLLSCILGQVPKISGVVKVRGLTAYVPQTPWIQSGKIVDNILFGKEMDVEKYKRVLEACSLNKDLEVLPFGDETIIGERGINLSGGQKQRIQIARALYQEADIYLLDDPFSALDAHTSTHLFKECVLGILASKTVIYVTHQMEFLPAADVILVMKEGRIEQAGNYNDISKSGTDFMKLVVANEQALPLFNQIETQTSEASTHLEENTEKTNSKQETDDDDDKEVNGEAARPKGQLVEEEEREIGRVGGGVYWKYITTAYKGCLVPFIVLSQILFVLLQTLSNYWISWSTRVSRDGRPAPTVDGYNMLLVYIALGAASSLFILVRATLLVTAGYKTASLLFHKMHLSIFSAPMSFFDANPNARILNRVSVDQSAVDLYTPVRVAGFVFSCITLLGIIVIMSMVVWQVYIIFIPIIALSLWYQQLYVPSSRELIRLAGIATAPIMHHFTETMSGIAIIRCFGHERRFCETSQSLINGHLRPDFYRAAVIQWLNFRLDMLSSLVFSCTLISFIFISVESLDPVIAGLAVTYALNLNELQRRVIMNFSLMENRMVSVERILQYTGIASEASIVVENHRPHISWPSRGQVDVKNLQVRYALRLPLVLRGITCSFPGGKKTGIVGRTGCGKSTLIQALFRIVEPAAGQILIDGTNISCIGLHDLRKRLSIIPQDPTMFQGTIRSNLDPLDEYSDEQIWEALDKCQLSDEVKNMEGKLDSVVSENGENWSVGQRQLICLSRVLLKRSKVVVLDEATASVDTATDNMIQQTLNENFSDSTIITVAHRITSVINSDQVIVLNHGVIEESDTPSSLLANPSSAFSKLVKEYSAR